jgi:hypothetical protein
VLYRKASGQASKLCFGTHVLMENRHGLCAAITVHNPIAQSISMKGWEAWANSRWPISVTLEFVCLRIRL